MGDVAAHRRLLVWIHSGSIKHSIHGSAQVLAVQRLVVARSTSIQLAAIPQGLKAVSLCSEYVKLRGAGCPKIPGQALFFIQQVRKLPAMASGLIGQLLRSVLGMGDQAVAATSSGILATNLSGSAEPP